MLTEGNWRVLVGHELGDELQEVRWGKDFSDVGEFGTSLINRVDVVVFLSAEGTPFVNGNESIFEDFLGVDLDEAAIALVSDTTTVVGFGNQVLDSVPLNLLALPVFAFEAGVLDAAHVVGNNVFANRVVRVVEGVVDIPAESLELLPLNENGVEPGETEDSLSEVALPIDESECFALIGVKSQEVGLDASGRLLSNQERPLQQTDGEVRVGRRRQEQSEVLVWLLLEQLVKHGLELGQESNTQVAVGQEGPLATRS